MANFTEVFNSDSFQAIANLTEVVGFSVMVATYVKTTAIKSKLFKGDKMVVNKDAVFNTFAFNPNYKGEIPLKEASFTGTIFIEPDGTISNGAEVFNQIPANPNKTYLVSKAVFDFCVSKGYRNVAMWDAKKTIYGDLPNGKRGALEQRGFTFGDEV